MRWKAGAVSAVAVLATAVTACSSSNGGGGGAAHPSISALDPAVISKPGPDTGWSDAGFASQAAKLSSNCGAPAKDNTRGITATSVRVGGLGYVTSPDGSSMADAGLAAAARFARANAEGGVNGRKIDYTGMQDDGNNPTSNGAKADVLVQQQKVFAVVPLMAALTNYFDTMCTNKVPFFGWGFNPGYCRNQIGFGINGCIVDDPSKGVKAFSTTYAVALKQIGIGAGKTAAIIGNDDSSAVAGDETIRRQLESGGIKVVYNKAVVPDTGLTDATPITTAVMTSNNGQPPDVILPITAFGSTLKLSDAFKSAGFKGVFFNPTAYDPRLAASPQLDGVYTVLLWTAGIQTAVPAIAQMQSDADKYAPKGTVLSLPFQAGWFAADMFVSALQKAGKDLTVDSFVTAVNDNWSYYLNGALAQTRWPVNHLFGAPCGSVVHLQNKTWTQVAPLACGQELAIK